MTSTGIKSFLPFACVTSPVLLSRAFKAGTTCLISYALLRYYRERQTNIFGLINVPISSAIRKAMETDLWENSMIDDSLVVSQSSNKSTNKNRIVCYPSSFFYSDSHSKTCYCQMECRLSHSYLNNEPLIAIISDNNNNRIIEIFPWKCLYTHFRHFCERFTGIKKVVIVNIGTKIINEKEKEKEKEKENNYSFIKEKNSISTSISFFWEHPWELKYAINRKYIEYKSKVRNFISIGLSVINNIGTHLNYGSENNNNNNNNNNNRIDALKYSLSIVSLFERSDPSVLISLMGNSMSLPFIGIYLRSSEQSINKEIDNNNIIDVKKVSLISRIYETLKLKLNLNFDSISVFILFSVLFTSMISTVAIIRRKSEIRRLTEFPRKFALQHPYVEAFFSTVYKNKSFSIVSIEGDCRKNFVDCRIYLESSSGNNIQYFLYNEEGKKSIDSKITYSSKTVPQVLHLRAVKQSNDWRILRAYILLNPNNSGNDILFDVPTQCTIQ